MDASAPPQSSDLIDPGAMTPALHDLMVPKLERVIAAAATGDRSQVHDAEREWAANAVAVLDIEIDVAGLDLVDTDRHYVVAPLHEGFADVLALVKLPLDLRWVIRGELLDLPLFSKYLRTAGHVAVEPEKPRSALRAMLVGGIDAFRAGESLVVFPQGSLLGIETAFQRGAFRLAERLGVPVLPVVLTGSHRVWEYPFASTIRLGQRMRMEVLEPVEPHRAVAQMRSLEREMKRRALACGEAPPRRYVPRRDGLWEGYAFDIDTDFPEVARAAGR